MVAAAYRQNQPLLHDHLLFAAVTVTKRTYRILQEWFTTSGQNNEIT
jgi:hypothetical protein